MRARRFALVAGGGTGGHTVPALALARALGDRRGPGAVELVGSRRGLDSSLVQGAGIPVTLLRGRGLSRGRSLAAAASNVLAILELAASLVASAVLVVRRRPAVVVAMGGYACVPTAMAAWLLRVPVVLVNLDAVPGAANRLVGRICVVAAVAFEGTALRRAVVTGAPVREEVVAAARPDDAAVGRAREALGLPSCRRVVAVVGGSLGAKRINEAVLGLAGIWSDRGDVAIYHVTGSRDARWAHERRAVTRGPQGLWYEQVDYERHMAAFYQAADVVVSRAGAMTVSELAVVGVPSVLVPLPGSPGDHQRANAERLERSGAAVVIDDASCDPARLAAEIDRLLADAPLLSSMRAAAASLGRPWALSAVESLVEEHATRRKGRGR